MGFVCATCHDDRSQYRSNPHLVPMSAGRCEDCGQDAACFECSCSRISRSEWLATLKVGDRVDVYERRDRRVYSAPRTIVRMTKTLFVLDNDERFKRKDGDLTPPYIDTHRHLRPVRVAQKG